MDPLSAGIAAGGNLVGGLVDAGAALYTNAKDWDHQKKVLKNQVQWRVDDAVKAGLHPLAALGMSPSSANTSVVPQIGDSISHAGENIARAVDAYNTPEDKLAARLMLANVERSEIERDIAKANLAGAQKALLTQGATPGLASEIPGMLMTPSAKGDKLGGGSAYWNDESGKAVKLGGGASAQFLENEFGELGGDLLGVSRLLSSWFNQQFASPPVSTPRSGVVNKFRYNYR